MSSYLGLENAHVEFAVTFAVGVAVCVGIWGRAVVVVGGDGEDLFVDLGAADTEDFVDRY